MFSSKPNRIYVDHLRRHSEGWLLRTHTLRSDVSAFPDLPIELPLSEIYKELDVPESLQLAWPLSNGNDN